MTRQPAPALGRATRFERAQSRAALGRLRDRVVQPRTLVRYEASIGWLFRVALMALGEVLSTNAIDFDEQLCRVIDMAWEEGESRSLIRDMLSGLAHKVHALHGRLPGAWRLHAAWGRLEMPLRAWPLSPSQVLALAYVALQWEMPDVSIALLVQYDCILRTGEIILATAADFQWGPGLSVLLSLHNTKGSARKGAPECVAVESPLVMGMLHWWLCEQRQPRLLARTSGDFRGIFNLLISECALQGHFRPYSLRRGGATAHFQACGSLDRTAERGRWGNLRKARIYINTGLSDKLQKHQDACCN